MASLDAWGDASIDSWDAAPAPPPVTKWEQWRCTGKYKGQDGQMRDCNALLGEFSFGAGSRARIMCFRCKMVNTREVLAVSQNGRG